jgi:hypothetical protein
VQWISRERSKEISNPLESRERSPVWEREWCGVCEGAGGRTGTSFERRTTAVHRDDRKVTATLWKEFTLPQWWRRLFFCVR